MKEQLNLLANVQKIEREIQSLQEILAKIPEKLNTFDIEITNFEKSLAKEESAIDELQKNYRSLEADVEHNQLMIAKSEEKLGFVKTNREYQATLTELEELNTKNSELEDEMINYLEEIDEIIANRDEKKEEFIKFTRNIEGKKVLLEQEKSEVMIKLSSLEEEHKSFINKIDLPLMEQYNYVKKQQADKIAIVPVKNSTCGGCYVNIPPQMYNELQRCDSIRFCPNCQRMIYWVKK